MKGNVGVNLNKELMGVMRSIKIPKMTKSHSNHHSNHNSKSHCCCNDANKKDYTFRDTVNSMKDCFNSNKDNCIIKSCVVDKDMKMNKKVISMIGMGALAATVLGTSIYSSMHNGRKKKKSHIFDISSGLTKLAKMTHKYM